MTETPTDAAAPADGGSATPTAEPAGNEWQPPANQAELDRIITDRVNREKAKYKDYGDLKNKASQFDSLAAASQTEAERAAAEGEKRGRTAAASEFGQRLARSEFDAVAGRRNPDFDTASALEWVDMAKFVGDDGEPDGKAIAAAVERLVPAPAGTVPSFDGGARHTAPAGVDMNQLIRRSSGRS